MILTLLCSSLCLSLLSDTRMLNISLCLNISGDSASNWYKACCPSELPPLNLSGDRSIGNGKYLPISTTDQEMPFLSTGPTCQEYSTKNTPCNHWWSPPLSSEFIFCNFFKYLWNPSFIIYFWFPLETACTGIIKVSWRLFLDIPEKVHLHPQQ